MEGKRGWRLFTACCKTSGCTGFSDIIRIEYNDEVLVNKPTNEVLEEYKSYLEKVEGHVPPYECEDEDWDDEE